MYRGYEPADQIHERTAKRDEEAMIIRMTVQNNYVEGEKKTASTVLEQAEAS